MKLNYLKFTLTNMDNLPNTQSLQSSLYHHTPRYEVFSPLYNPYIHIQVNQRVVSPFECLSICTRFSCKCNSKIGDVYFNTNGNFGSSSPALQCTFFTPSATTASNMLCVLSSPNIFLFIVGDDIYHHLRFVTHFLLPIVFI